MLIYYGDHLTIYISNNISNNYIVHLQLIQCLCQYNSVKLGKINKLYIYMYYI